MRQIAFMIAAGLLALAGCASDKSTGPDPIGDFALGHMVVVAKNLQATPGSRVVDPDTWAATTRNAVRTRLGGFEGDRLYNIALSLDAYLLAPPGIPVVLAPKSAIVARISVWDDAEGRLMTPEPVQISVLEKLEAKSVLGKGLFLDGDAQMQELTEQLAKRVENWLRAQQAEQGWFVPDPDAPDLAADAADPVLTGLPDGAGQTIPPLSRPAVREGQIAPRPKLRP